MTLRRNPITGDPVIFAPARAERPRAFVDGSDEARCPFCPGHEEDTPPEIVRLGDPWRARVFPNKYPPLPGAEVIVESPEHDATFGEDVVRLYVDRYRAHTDAAYVAIFKNHGARGGASIPHIHSQLVPMPFVPPRVERELAGFRDARECPLCAAVDPELVIRETNAFVWLAPSASAMAYQQWIVPKRHVNEISQFSDEEAGELAMLLRSASTAMLALTDAYNWMLMNFPRLGAAHCYVDLFPRLTSIAGLELGTGTFVEIIDPVAAARRLRAVL